ncbi:single-stranded-DNA-specific exonuclease RecJ [bacterium]|nr:single-stranded-DNA-specific exonuclease RecJ [bacterium]
MNKKNSYIINKLLSKKVKSEISNINPVILQLLYNRDVFKENDSEKKRNEKINNFLNPRYENLYDPFLLKDMDKAVLRLEKAIKNKEKTVIFGDYDADGVTSSSVLFEALTFLGSKPLVYIPHREKEGYGLNKEAIDSFKKKKIDLVITVDCGIRNKEEISYAKKLKIDVIVTDHHEVDKKDLPNKAIALINPKQKDCKYPFKLLAGVGVAYKLAQALIRKAVTSEDRESFLKWLLDFVAIGSIGDMVPLIDENRILVNYGHIVFDKSRRLGIVEMKKNSRNLNGRFIDFFVAPRINAAGRMDHALWAFNLLTTQSKIEAYKLLKRIEELNNKRKNLTEVIVAEAKKEIIPVLPEEKFIFVSKKGWSAAVSGIVSNRLVDEFGLPAFVAADSGEYSKGSARSPRGVDLMKLLSPAASLFEKIGGHKHAAGFTYKSSNKDKIIKLLVKSAAAIKIDNDSLKIEVDLEVNIQDINLDVYREVLKLAPFGEGNPMPIFILKNVVVVYKKMVGRNHLKILIEKDGIKKEAIGFNKMHLEPNISQGDNVDIIFRLGENEYRGMKSVQVEIIDIIKK